MVCFIIPSFLSKPLIAEVIEFGPNGQRVERVLVGSVQEYSNGRPVVVAKTEEPTAEVRVSVPVNRTARAQPGPAEVLDLIATTANRYSNHPALRKTGLEIEDWHRLFRANIQIESMYRQSARSHVGAIGLGQLMPETARRLGVDPYDAAQNLDGSARYLLSQLYSFGKIEFALAAYNAGPNAVRRYDGIPPYAETRGHVRKVLSVYRSLGGETERLVTEE